jgi:hypothetical protein
MFNDELSLETLPIWSESKVYDVKKRLSDDIKLFIEKAKQYDIIAREECFNKSNRDLIKNENYNISNEYEESARELGIKLVILKVYDYPNILNNKIAFNIILKQNNVHYIYQLINLFQNENILNRKAFLRVINNANNYYKYYSEFLEACKIEIFQDHLRTLWNLSTKTHYYNDEKDWPFSDLVKIYSIPGICESLKLQEMFSQYYSICKNLAPIFENINLAANDYFIDFLILKLQEIKKGNIKEIETSKKIIEEADDQNTILIENALLMPQFKINLSFIFTMLSNEGLKKSVLGNINNTEFINEFKNLCMKCASKNKMAMELLIYLSNDINFIFDENNIIECKYSILHTISKKYKIKSTSSLKEYFKIIDNLDLISENNPSFIIKLANEFKNKLNPLIYQNYVQILLNEIEAIEKDKQKNI